LLAAACAGRAIDEALELDAAAVRRQLLGPMAHALGVPGFERDHLAASLLWERRRADAAEAIAALARAGIPTLLIKGIAYAGRLYADPATRPMTDVDLLIAPDAIAAATRALGRLGYWPAGDARERTRFHHAVTLKRSGAAIDLHRSIRQPLRAGARLPRMWLRAERSPIPGALVPAPVDEAVIGLALIARHDLIVPAIVLVDGARLLARVDRGAVLERARAVGLGRGVAAVARVIDAAVSGAEHQIVDRITDGPPLGRPRQLARKLALADGPIDALRLAANAALAMIAS
jgi:hypothetical protein